MTINTVNQAITTHLLGCLVLAVTFHSIDALPNATVFCQRGPPTCATLLCEPRAGIWNCLFAPLKEGSKVYIGQCGSWNGDIINNLNIKEYTCTGNNCCLKSILASNSNPKIKVKMQLYQTTNVNVSEIKIINYTQCVQASPLIKTFDPPTVLNSFPKNCLNLTHYCNFTTTTPSTSTALVTTQPTTQTQTFTTTPPTTRAQATTKMDTTSTVMTATSVTQFNATTSQPTTNPLSVATLTLQSVSSIFYSTTASTRPLAPTSLSAVSRSVNVTRSEFIKQAVQAANNSTATEVNLLNLTTVGNKTIVTSNNTSPVQLKLSQTSVNGLSPQFGGSWDVVIVVVEFKLPQNVQTFTAQTSHSGIKTEVLPFPGAPTISITVIDANSHSKVSAKLNYVISLQNTTSQVQAMLNQIINNKSSNGKYGVTRINKIETKCGFFDTTQQRFSTRGCSLLASNSSQVSCFCNHTTLFAALLSVQSFPIPSEVVFLSYITEAISISCLIITISILMTVRKKVRSDRTVVQINLSVALLCFHILNLANVWALVDKRLCETMTILTHFFLLATGTWMLLEGITLYLKTTDRILTLNKKSPRKVAGTKLALGWGIPLLIVLLASAIGFPTNRYMDSYVNNYYRCWVGTQNKFLLGSVIIPMVVFYATNVVIAIKVIWFVHKLKSSELKPSASRSSSANAENIGAAVKVFLMLFPVLGLPLFFAFMTSIEPYEASVVFMYINVILNGLQGLFLLFVYCVLCSEVREAAGRSFERIRLRYSKEESTKLHTRSSHNAPSVAMT